MEELHRRFDDQPLNGNARAGAGSDRRSTYSRWRRMRERRIGGSAINRDLLRRLKQPVIGLTLAGVAMPMIKQSDSGETAPRQKSGESASSTTDPIAAAGALEDEVGKRWKEASDAAAGRSSRADTVQQAVQKYDISPDLATKIVDAAARNGIDPKIALGLVKTESTFNTRAVSHVGARGLTQVMPRTAKWLQPGTTAEDLFKPDLNLDLGFRYLRDLIDKYNGNTELALLAYNRGPGTVDKILKRGGNPDNGYAAKVLRG